MKTRAFIITLILQLSVTSIFAQNMTASELENKINELERRIALLEKIVLENNSGPIKETINNTTADKANWRKLCVKMKDIEVRELLGEPVHIKRVTPTLYIWEYSNEGWHSTITFNEKGVFSWSEPE